MFRKNWEKVWAYYNCRPNLPPEEIQALDQLIQLQKNRVITIKPCDKGAGIILLDFEDYKKVDDNLIEETKAKIKEVLEEGLKNEFITNEEMEAMDPSDKNLESSTKCLKSTINMS